MRHSKIQLSPSMMCADFLHVEDELRLLEKYGIDWLHIDVMDGHYVPNFTLGVDYCRAVANATQVPLDIHLMVEHPERHVESFGVFPGARLTFHPETVRQPVRLIERIRELGASPGLALDPGHTFEHFKHLIPMADQILVMTVSPGYAGQKLLPHCLEKVAELKAWLVQEGLEADIEVDGNVSWENIPPMIEAGANILVLGTSSLFERHRARAESLEELRGLIDRLENRSTKT